MRMFAGLVLERGELYFESLDNWILMEEDYCHDFTNLAMWFEAVEASRPHILRSYLAN